MHKYHVLTETAARRLGIVDAAGNSREHEATLDDVAAADAWADFCAEHSTAVAVALGGGS